MGSIEHQSTHLALQDKAVEEVQRCLALAEAFFGRTFELDSISFDLRGRSAGQFRVRSIAPRKAFNRGVVCKELRFNADLLNRYGEQFILETVGHEVAHFLVSELYQKRVKPHGKEWQSIMVNVLGLEPEVTHRYDIKPARTLKTFLYGCACVDRTHELTSIRHGRVQRRTARYMCRACGAPLHSLES